MITKDQALSIAGKHMAGFLKVTDGIPKFGAVYRTWPEDEEVWCVHVPNNIDMVGGSRVILISKKSGQVLFDGTIGE